MSALPNVNFTDWVPPTEEGKYLESMKVALQGCPYDVIQLSTAQVVNATVEAMLANGCSLAQTVIGSFDTNDRIYNALGNGQLTVTVSQQTYLQGAFPLLMAALYVTTGQTLVPSSIASGTYLTGPQLVTYFSNLLSESLQTCEKADFPLCPAPRSACTCSERGQVKILAITHGVSTDSFWDPVYSAMEQAGQDYGINLTTWRPDIDVSVHEEMIREITAACQSGIDGLVTSFPSKEVSEAARQCLDQEIPVISINSGSKFAESMGVQEHIGQLEFRSGYDAGIRLIKAGTKRGICLAHESDNSGLIERCNGMQQAFNDSSSPTRTYSYLGMHAVPDSHGVAEYRQVVDAALENDYDGAGTLIMGLSQKEAILSVQRDHPNLIVGTFDVDTALNEALEKNQIIFGISQNSYLQGYLPIPLLVWGIHTKQTMANKVMEVSQEILIHLRQVLTTLQTGPSFITSPPDDKEQVCRQNEDFKVCTRDEQSSKSNSLSTGAIVGIAVGGVVVAVLVLFALRKYCSSPRASPSGKSKPASETQEMALESQ